MSLLSLLGISRDRIADDERDADALRRLIDELESLEPRTAHYLASFAFLLARVADADRVVDPRERRRMEEIIRDCAGLHPAQAVLVVEIARHRERLAGSGEQYAVAREFRRVASTDQCRALVDCLWAVAAADGHLAGGERAVVRQVACELGVAAAASGGEPGPSATRREALGALLHPAAT
jgi:uncharacterized tellurite resistance protein B-like protein